MVSDGPPIYDREGVFNFGFKLISSLICIIVCIIYKVTTKKNDYFWVFITGTLILTLVETLLQISGTRETPEAMLFGWQVPIYLQVLLQGISEGAWIAILGLVFTDLLRGKKVEYGGVSCLLLI